jgi:hypothetical protein
MAIGGGSAAATADSGVDDAAVESDVPKSYTLYLKSF